MNIKENIKRSNLEPLFTQAIFGIEKESQRILADGTITTTDHPDEFGNRNFHPYIQTDFAETQMELVTPPLNSVEEVMNWLAAIHDVSLRTIPENEYLLPTSSPLFMPTEDEIHVAKLDNADDVAYREYLVDVYGKRKQMVSGIHYNFEFHPDFVHALYEEQASEMAFKDFQSRLYLKLAHNFFRYQWLLTYLLGASIEAKPEFFKNEERPSDIPEGLIRSIRSSHHGYVNNDDVKVSFESMEDYVQTIEQMVKDGKLIEEKEFYSTVRFRGGKNAREILKNGISYLEFRLLDLNPFAEFGIEADDIHFIHYFLMYLIWMDDEATVADLEIGKQMNFNTALEHPHSKSAYYEEGLAILSGIQEMLTQLNLETPIIDQKIAAFNNPELTLAGQLAAIYEADYTGWVIEQAKAYKKAAQERPYALRGFETMELSTQILIFDAIQKGLKVDVLDVEDQFLSLKYQEHLEYVKNGNMTSLDTYISSLVMANKVVTKKILANNGYIVPASKEYHHVAEALRDYGLFKAKRFVVKPKSTNYGLGISIFKEGASEENYRKAIEIAFEEDSTVLVEDFVPGTEYRFFVAGDETKAVLLRIPANVIGDGTHTIEELVEIKNQDPLRGMNHRTPLTLIQLGKIEQLALEEQGYVMTDIPAEGTTVYLRDNSNISTGGDSIDMTAAMHESYKEIAVGIAKAVGATFSGVDMMIPDYRQPSTKEAPGYGVIEANFNPAMMMHIYPHEGEGQRLTLDVLDLLFPEMNIKGDPI
ncbi:MULTISPECIES: bifunctional glutamate--cysteine ligase GshA/glutathione synthetase GshB [unclassified Jeotgalibaca]|uniref:bifunctional glutamate--cysteine ligase GshA/glutathione synthetase GshB n=1 Tax=unclassified Jeotgalibaca TaxID=2621505 RepID=UPI003FD1F30F